MKSLSSMSYEWFDAICWSSLLFGIFINEIICPVYSYSFRYFEIRFLYKNKWNVEFSTSQEQFIDYRA